MKIIGKRCLCIGMAALIFFAVSMFGCSISGGANHHVNPTIGQELIDLKKALDEEVISEQEYWELREKLTQSDKFKG